VLQREEADGTVRAGDAKRGTGVRAGWLPAEAEGPTPLDRVFGLTPEAYARFRDLYGALFDPDRVDPALVELCRLRIAQLVGCDADADVELVSPEKIAELRSWPTSPRYTETDRAVLSFAEKFVMDASDIDDADCRALTDRLSPAECTALTIAISTFDGLARFRVALAA
jgi:alkylhydroperoxidase family enzyme